MKKQNKLIFYIAFVVFFMSCEQKKSAKKINIISEVPSNFEMYKTSEMSELMRTMLQKNNELREQIIKGEDIGDFNEAYLKIHTAKMTDASQRDETYPAFAKYFEEMQKEIFSVNKEMQKEQFNKAVNACIACHQDRCVGPIPRIQKLKIK